MPDSTEARAKLKLQLQAEWLAVDEELKDVRTEALALRRRAEDLEGRRANLAWRLANDFNDLPDGVRS